jgi:hypothetical protein
MKNHLFLLLFLLLICSCGIFQPREIFEIPELKLPVDRFNFSAILKTKRFTWKSNETFFSDTLQYRDMKNSGEYSKRDMINHLQQIEHQYPRCSIIWGEITVSSDDGNVLNISNVSYTAICDTALANGEKFTGTSKMTIVRDGEYKVVTWDDFPDSEQKSFFAPLD